MSESTSTPTHHIQHRAEKAASHWPDLLIKAERVAATTLQGVHGRRRTGMGESFWQFRRYEHGDDLTRVDWRQTAKTQHVFIRETEWEAAQSLWIWPDHSPSMHWASTDNLPSKWDRAMLLSLALTVLLVRTGERVALLGRPFPPGSGRGQMAKIAEEMAHRRLDEENLPPVDSLPRHSNLVLISDFLEPIENLQSRLVPYADRQIKGILLQVLDPAEQDIPWHGRVEFEGLEGEESVTIPRVGAIKEQYKQAISAHQDQLTSLANSLGWDFAVHHTNRPTNEALMALYMQLAQEVV